MWKYGSVKIIIGHKNYEFEDCMHLSQMVFIPPFLIFLLNKWCDVTKISTQNFEGNHHSNVFTPFYMVSIELIVIIVFWGLLFFWYLILFESKYGFKKEWIVVHYSLKQIHSHGSFPLSAYPFIPYLLITMSLQLWSISEILFPFLQVQSSIKTVIDFSVQMLYPIEKKKTCCNWQWVLLLTILYITVYLSTLIVYLLWIIHIYCQTISLLLVKYHKPLLTLLPNVPCI